MRTGTNRIFNNDYVFAEQNFEQMEIYYCILYKKVNKKKLVSKNDCII